MSINKISFLYPIHDRSFEFDREELTSLELSGRTAHKVNEIIELVNLWVDGLPQSMIDIINKRVEDGTFGDLINQVLLGDINNKINSFAVIKQFGVVGDGVTDDSEGVKLAEQSNFKYIDLMGFTINTDLYIGSLKKNYYNGTIVGKSITGTPIHKKPSAPWNDYELQRPRSKSPIVDWENKNVLWLGTSIPHQGGNADSYPTLFGEALKCNVNNMAWASSHATYHKDADPNNISTVMSLSMTQDDVKVGLAKYGHESAYSDTFDVITWASQMTCDFRIKKQFFGTAYDCVMLDHNHNDIRTELGTLTPETFLITAIEKGKTTLLTIPKHGFVVGDALAIENAGIEFLHHACARVQSITENSVVINADSSNYSGEFYFGNAIKLNRATFYGAYEFLIHYIKNCAIISGKPECKIVLSSAPNEYSAFADTPDEMFVVSVLLRNIAEKWDLPFFDIAYNYHVNKNQVRTYFEDGWHPMNVSQRQSLANHWIAWACGGALKPFTEKDFSKIFPVSINKNFRNQREALYSEFTGGFGTPDFIIDGKTTLTSDNFSSGNLSNWTVLAGDPEVINAPWDNNEKSVKFHGSSLIEKTLAFTDGKTFSFDMWLPVVEGLSSQSYPTTTDIAGTAFAGVQPHINLQLVGYANSLKLRMLNISDETTLIYGKEFNLDKETKYRIRVEYVKGTANYRGVAILYINDQLFDIIKDFDDSGRVQSNMIRVGTYASNEPNPFTMYMSNIEAGNLTLHDYTKRYTGNIQASNGTFKVVNGIITGLV